MTEHISAPEADIRLDITAIDLPDESFDVITCMHVLEHIPDDLKAMRELRRVLRPGGTAYILVPMSQETHAIDEDPSVTDAEERARRSGQFDHCRVYGRDLRTRLETAGFVGRSSPRARCSARIDTSDIDCGKTWCSVATKLKFATC